MRLLRIFPEIVDGCNMACALCWNRNRAGSFRQMPLSTVEKVIERFGKSPKYFWYNWGEPLLYSNFHDFVEIVKGTRSTISSNFSMKLTDQHFEDLSKLANVIVSLSGMTEEVYGIYHRGGNHATVMQNIQRLVGLPKVTINWLHHKYNAHQVVDARAFCEKNGFAFEFVPLNCEVEDLCEDFAHPLMDTTKNSRRKCKIKKWIPISVDGEYLLCCASHNVKTGYTIWDDITPSELTAVKEKVPLCKMCAERELWRMY